ncbi:MAG: preprotein translocase subunit SecG, partial [Candidatus Scalindua sediminis]
MNLKWITAIVIIFGLLTMFYTLQWSAVLKPLLILFCFVLIGTVLMQAGRGGGLAAIGGLSDQSTLGTKTSSVLTKFTYLMGASFIFTTILLTKLTLTSIHGTGTIG